MDAYEQLLSLWHDWRLLLLLCAAGVLLALSFYHNHKSPQSDSADAEKREPTVALTTRTLIRDAQPSKRFEAAKEISATLPRPRSSPKRIIGSKKASRSIGDSTPSPVGNKIQPLVFFSSLTGTTAAYAEGIVKSFGHSLGQDEKSQIAEPRIHDLSYIDYDDFFVALPRKTSPADGVRYFYLLLLPTYNIDTTLNAFLGHLRETHHDFRIDTAPLSGLAGYSVFGFGDKEGWPTEEDGFCSQAREVDKWMAKLTGGKRAYPLGMGDVRSDAAMQLMKWRSGVDEVLKNLSRGEGLGEGVPGSGDAFESDDEETDEAIAEEGDTEVATNSVKQGRIRRSKGSAHDLEDLGSKALSKASPATANRDAPVPVDFTTSSSTIRLSSTQNPMPMVPTSSPTYAALTKQGYAIIGSHSGVKICRWTKSALRGRGSCYKHSFYGIASHLCMETTPSLSCSNKCVFCWRHGTNPVGTTWRWQVDQPELIFTGAKEAHLKKIKMMRGVPGVRAERFQEAMRIRHCALSLVGEPIFYPYINEFVALLHGERISSFLVCNAQHPDQLAALKVVTQLYVSIDASNRDSLRKVDRPLHRDFWERFLRCLDILRERRNRMRTVFRLTLVKGFNIDNEVEGYADLVARGLPCFVEIKGVTYCGTSTSASAGLTMQNVPFYSEVSAFVLALNHALARRGLEYGIAAEHAHSCCVLLASTRFRKEGRWHTLIDYERFFELLESGKEFGPEDYMGAPTPEWAAWGKGGFDPSDERVDRKGRKIELKAN